MPPNVSKAFVWSCSILIERNLSLGGFLHDLGGESLLLPNLHSVSLVSNPAVWADSRSWDRVLNPLGVLSKYPSVHSITLHIINLIAVPRAKDSPASAIQNLLKTFDDRQWLGLDSVLKSFQGLRSVDFAISTPNGDTGSTSIMVEEVRNYFSSRNDLWMVREGYLTVSRTKFEEERRSESGYVPPGTCWLETSVSPSWLVPVTINLQVKFQGDMLYGLDDGLCNVECYVLYKVYFVLTN